MKSNAAGQLLGYTLQIPRALYHLLRCGPGESVCIEVVGDVATKMRNGEVLTEEDKSSLSGKPVTDKSVDLWKTFYNWIEAINNNYLDENGTRFILYCNQKGKKSLVDEFSGASTKGEVNKAIENAKDKLNDLDPEHAIWDHYNYTIKDNVDLFEKVVMNFEVQYGDAASYDEVDYELKKQHIPLTQIDFFRDQLAGWLLKEIQERIFSKKQACISWEEYHKQFSVLFERIRQRELIDFTLDKLPDNKVISKEVGIRPCYLRQLEHIGCSDDDMIEAVSDYLRADVNRHKWIENEIIDEEIAVDFFNKLKSFWSTQNKKIRITQKGLSDEEKGQLLLEECKGRQESIRGISPPYPTISGTYHALANEPTLGWHPAWEKIFLGDGSK